MGASLWQLDQQNMKGQTETVLVYTLHLHITSLVFPILLVLCSYPLMIPHAYIGCLLVMIGFVAP